MVLDFLRRAVRNRCKEINLIMNTTLKAGNEQAIYEIGLQTVPYHSKTTLIAAIRGSYLDIGSSIIELIFNKKTI